MCSQQTQTEWMVWFISACPSNCKTCKTSNQAIFTQTTGTEIRECDTCDTGFYVDPTDKLCKGKDTNGEKITESC